MNEFFLEASNFVWSYVVVGLCFVVGLFFTLRLLFIQFRTFPHAISLLFGRDEDKDEKDGITTFQALATALSSTTGIGNIAGVAVAIKVGGPGAIFWMWVMAVLGMALKFAEGTLGNLYRRDIGGRHEMGGGPMYYIVAGLGERWRPVAAFYAGCTAIACLGAWNMFQSNQAAATLKDQMHVPTWVTGGVLCLFVALVLIGGIKRIGRVAEKLVPSMCLIYVSGVFIICLLNIDRIPLVFGLIVDHAFRFDSAGGGILGTAILIGIRRAVFSNEAGTGSAAMAHAAAHSSHPVKQGVVASLGPFIDTIVVCAATAMVIILSGYYGTESYQNKSERVISFEAGEPTVTSSNTKWQINGQAIVRDDGRLQRFSHGNATLALQAGADAQGMESPKILISSLLPADEAARDEFSAIRFSAWVSVPNLQVRLANANGDFNLVLPVSGASVTQAQTTTTISTDAEPESWGSYIITPDADLRQQLTVIDSDDEIYLQFVSSGAGEVYVDRIEAVESVNGIVLSSAAFAQFFGAFGTIFIPIAALFFAYTTILAGNYYGEVACHFFSEKLVQPYLWLYIAATFLGCVVNLDVVINFSDLTLGLMTIPNLVAMVLLTPVVASQTADYFRQVRQGKTPVQSDK